MSKQSNLIKPISLALGATFAATLAASNIANATPAGENPFAMSDLNSGFMQVADKGKEGKCGEGKKAGDKSKEGKCGEGKCGEDKKGKKEGKCGEGKCGGKK
ncbi:MAG: low-complexity protein [Gammaproteobacteria bacterium]|nr:low-complexity protein [Gammaproteobacteria bacterium]